MPPGAAGNPQFKNRVGGPQGPGAFPPMQPGMGGPVMGPAGMQGRGPGRGMPGQPGAMGPPQGPMGGRGMGPAGVMGGPRPMFPGQPQLSPQQAAAVAQQQAQMRGQVKFNNQVRNQGGAMMPGAGMMAPNAQQMMMQQQMGGQQMQQAGAAGEFSDEALASADPHTQKNMIGERLYPLIRVHQPEQAGKITGMLLEMDNGELLNLIESPDALMSKIEEALNVLRNHKASEE